MATGWRDVGSAVVAMCDDRGAPFYKEAVIFR